MLPSRIFFDNFLDDIDSKKFDKMMKCDIYEEDNMYHVLVEVPGFKKEDIKIEFENGYLKVIAENSQEENEDKKYLRKERTSMTRCERSFYFGELNEDLIKAEFKDGILNISVPKDKSEEVVKKIINID
ncbi:MAG: Hsp20 family protein [Erysipelotrichaceae bacterium]|nr:Hsp20 family protein [Erysipelotrichaceae bacterium]MDD6093769.1 Hsp20 family protein [bacterium]MDY3934778.1 Hsp20 family protein [Bacilli bacterium]